jgi:hypothetical protein
VSWRKSQLVRTPSFTLDLSREEGRGAEESQLLVCYRPETDIRAEGDDQWGRIRTAWAGSEKGATFQRRGG